MQNSINYGSMAIVVEGCQRGVVGDDDRDGRVITSIIGAYASAECFKQTRTDDNKQR